MREYRLDDNHGLDLNPLLQPLIEDTALLSDIKLVCLGGHASSRIYWRITSPFPFKHGEKTLMAMHLPEDALKSDELGSTAPSTLPFLMMQTWLEHIGLPVPKVLAHDLSRRLVLLEDLGDESFEARLLSSPEQKDALYKQAIDLLCTMQTKTNEALKRGDSVLEERCFGREILEVELEHFFEWALELYPEARKTELVHASSLLEEKMEILDLLIGIQKGFVHRDYQSRNLMWKTDTLYLIDFQDGLLGPYVYDLVALLCDSYVDHSLEFQNVMIAYYANKTGRDVRQTQQDFWLVALHRKMKDTGRFVFIDRVRNNPSFLKHIPQSLVYVKRSLEQVQRTHSRPGFLSSFKSVLDVI